MLLCCAGAAQRDGQEAAQLGGGCCGCQDHAGSAQGISSHVSAYKQLASLYLSSSPTSHKSLVLPIQLS